MAGDAARHADANADRIRLRRRLQKLRHKHECDSIIMEAAPPPQAGTTSSGYFLSKKTPSSTGGSGKPICRSATGQPVTFLQHWNVLASFPFHVIDSKYMGFNQEAEGKRDY